MKRLDRVNLSKRTRKGTTPLAMVALRSSVPVYPQYFKYFSVAEDFSLIFKSVVTQPFKLSVLEFCPQALLQKVLDNYVTFPYFHFLPTY